MNRWATFKQVAPINSICYSSVKFRFSRRESFAFDHLKVMCFLENRRRIAQRLILDVRIDISIV